VPEANLLQLFPALDAQNHQIESPLNGRYNCVSWAMEDTARFWWPSPMGGAFWPHGIARVPTLGSFMQAFAQMGYQPCQTADLEPDYKKIALYADASGVPTHVARQLPSGEWTSKIGRDEDIRHATLGVLEGGGYGHVARIFRRSTAAPPVPKKLKVKG